MTKKRKKGRKKKSSMQQPVSFVNVILKMGNAGHSKSMSSDGEKYSIKSNGGGLRWEIIISGKKTRDNGFQFTHIELKGDSEQIHMQEEKNFDGPKGRRFPSKDYTILLKSNPDDDYFSSISILIKG